MDLILLFFPEGRARIASSFLMIPDAIVPEKPRKLRFGRRTYCTGNLIWARLRSEAMWTVSKCAKSGGPAYQGIFGDLSTTLSPLRALRGMTCTSAMRSLAQK